MTLVERRAVTRCAVVLLVIAMGAGCAFASWGSGPGTTRARLIDEATRNYVYMREREPVPVNDVRLNQPNGKLPRITIATMGRIDDAGRRRSNRFIARLNVTGGAYRRMGLAPGVNYVWRDSAGRSASRWWPSRGSVGLALISFFRAGGTAGPERTLIVPEDPSYPMRWLEHDTGTTAMSGNMSELPRLVMSASAYGMCDNGCSGGHCVTFQAAPGDVSNTDGTIVIGP